MFGKGRPIFFGRHNQAWPDLSDGVCVSVLVELHDVDGRPVETLVRVAHAEVQAREQPRERGEVPEVETGLERERQNGKNCMFRFLVGLSTSNIPTENKCLLFLESSYRRAFQKEQFLR